MIKPLLWEHFPFFNGKYIDLFMVGFPARRSDLWRWWDCRNTSSTQKSWKLIGDMWSFPGTGTCWEVSSTWNPDQPLYKEKIMSHDASMGLVYLPIYHKNKINHSCRQNLPYVDDGKGCRFRGSESRKTAYSFLPWCIPGVHKGRRNCLENPPFV